ncbi:MAG: diacylglycerol kinase family protein [Ruminococcus sp.]|nr:diacylglycerol kinase family protein [Ruminococcus sp.]
MKKRFLKQVHSFYYAIRGLLSVLKTESHMRFHLVAGLYVVAFCSKFYELSATKWCVLLFTISLVFITEILNTVLERVCDSITKEYSKDIEFIKDVSAGAVLVGAVGSVIIAFLLLFDIETFKNIFYHFTHNLVDLVFLIIGTVIAILFIGVKPESYLRIFKRKK